MNIVHRALSKLQRMNRQRRFNAAARRYAREFPRAARGSAEWLIGSELKYGGIVTNVPRNKVSPLDPRAPEQIRRGGMTGGDRMLHHGYAPAYARHLSPYVSRDTPPLLMEVGILKGTGLAIWCDLFPTGKVIGLDIDPDHFRSNVPDLEARGAFGRNAPEVHVFDQLQDGQDRMGEILAGAKADIVIDDGLHTEAAILNTLRAVEPYLAERFVYFVEDNDTVAPVIASSFPHLVVESLGLMTILTRA
jgi:hypothetical protein